MKQENCTRLARLAISEQVKTALKACEEKAYGTGEPDHQTTP